MVGLKALFGSDSEILRNTEYQLILSVAAVSSLGIALISPILEPLSTAFGVSSTRVGLLLAAVSLPSLVIIPVMGLLIDRRGRKPFLVGSLLLFGCAGVAITLTNSFVWALLFRLFQGVGLAFLTPLVTTLIGDLYEGPKQTLGQGFRVTVSGVSQTVFPLMAGGLVLIAWQYPFLLYGISIPIGVLIYLSFEDDVDVGSAQSGDGSVRQYFRNLGILVADRRTFAVLTAFTAMIFLYFVFFTYNSVIVIRLLDGTPQQAGLLVAIASFVYASVATQTGRVRARSGSLWIPLVGGNISMGIGLSMLSLAPTFSVAVLGVVFITIGSGITASFYRGLMTDFAPDSLRGGLVSVMETSNRLAAFTAPVITGFIIAWGQIQVGFTTALRWTVLGSAIACGLVGIVCSLVIVE